ncbi:hypothetical protein Tco_1420407 [Tanacetum coccineum]
MKLNSVKELESLRDIEIRDNKIENLRNELEEVKKEKDNIDVKIKNFENSAKDLDCLLGTQRSVKDKTGLGLNEYTAVPPSPATRPTPSIDVSKDVSDEQKAIWKSNSAFFSEQRGSVGNVVSKPMTRFIKETDCPSVSKVNNTEKSKKPTVKYAEMYRKHCYMDAQTQGRHEHDQEFDAEITTVGAEVDDIAAET